MWQENGIQNPHTRHRPTLSVRISWIVKSIKKPSEQLHNIETEVKTWIHTLKILKQS